MEGTNNEHEAFQSFKRIGLNPRYVHVNELQKKTVSLENFSSIFLPGGFSAGDYIRAGVIFANRIAHSSFAELRNFVDSGKPVIGVCNGFQVLCELGFLPGWQYDNQREVVLGQNTSNRYECRNTYIARTSENEIFSKAFPQGMPFLVPVAHSEGKIQIQDKERNLERLLDEGQILFRYSDGEGKYGGYPWNPNGSDYDIAAISNVQGNVIGLMPHPERMFYRYRTEDKRKFGGTAIGELFFNSIKEYILRKGY